MQYDVLGIMCENDSDYGFLLLRSYRCHTTQVCAAIQIRPLISVSLAHGPIEWSGCVSKNPVTGRNIVENQNWNMEYGIYINFVSVYARVFPYHVI